MFQRTRVVVAVLMGLLLTACTSAGSYEKDQFDRARTEREDRLSRAIEKLPEPDAAAQQPSQLSGDLTLERLVRLSELHSPKLRAAFERWRASVSGITVVTKLPDATLSYSEFLSSIETRLGPIERRFMLSQMVPNPGKLVARERQAAGNAEAMRANFEATRLGVREALMVAFADLQALDIRVSIVQKMADLLRSIEKVLDARVRANLAPQSALLRVQVEAESLESEASTLRNRRVVLISALSTAVGQRIDPEATVPSLSDASQALPNKAKLVALATAHPSVSAEFAKVAIADAKVDEAGWMWVPDLMFGIEYQMVGQPDIPRSMRDDDAGRDAISVTVGLTIPWQFHVNKARGDMARAERQAAQYMVQDRQLMMRHRLEEQLFAWKDAERLVVLYQDTVLPKARQTLELLRSEFVSEKATLTDILDAERSLLAAELSLINARVDQQKAEARLESIVARDLATIK